jgi:hypothetical protein
MNKSLKIFLTFFLTGFTFTQINAQQIGFIKIKVNETATIYLNNKNLGDLSPNEQILKEVQLGTHQIKVMKEGYETQIQNIQISIQNEIKELTFVLSRPQSFKVDKDVSGRNLNVEYGELTVITKYSGSLVPAKVYVDDIYADNAPVKLASLFVGRHSIMTEYNSIKKTKYVDILKNNKNVLEIEMLSFSQVEFSSSIEDISVVIDGSKEITIPSQQNLSFGIHHLKISKQNYIPIEKEISVDGESKYNVLINLNQNYPNIEPYELGRSYKQPYPASDFLRPESKNIKDNKNRWLGMGIGGGLAVLIGAAAIDGVGAGGYFGILAAGITIPLIFIKPKINKVPDYENIRYNQTEVPKILKNKNSDIDNYNNETKILIRQKQIERYSESAIKIMKND